MDKRTLVLILENVENCRSITDLAEHLYLSQPYVSKMLGHVEEKYHVKLVRRKPLPIELTDAGKILLKDLQQEIEIKNKITIDLAPYAENNANYIRIATNQPYLTMHGAELLLNLHKKYPDIRFQLSEVTSNLAQQALKTRNIDLFWGKTFHDSEIVNYKSHPLKMYFLIPESSNLYSSEYVRNMSKKDLIQFNKAKFVSLTDDSFFQQMVDHAFSDNGITIEKVLKVSNSLIGTAAAVRGIGIFITIFEVARPWIGQCGFNMVEIPENFLHMEVGVSTLHDASPMIKRIGQDVDNFLCSRIVDRE